MVLILSATLLLTSGSSEMTLFRVKKSGNRNELVYLVRLDEACRPAGGKPVVARWLMREQGESIWEELLPFERAFYELGDQLRLDEYRVETYARAAPDHPFVVFARRVGERCQATAEADVAGHPATIASVSVQLAVLGVRSATVFATALLDGRQLAENLR